MTQGTIDAVVMIVVLHMTHSILSFLLLSLYMVIPFQVFLDDDTNIFIWRILFALYTNP